VFFAAVAKKIRVSDTLLEWHLTFPSFDFSRLRNHIEVGIGQSAGRAAVYKPRERKIAGCLCITSGRAIVGADPPSDCIALAETAENSFARLQWANVSRTKFPGSGQ